MTKAIKKSKISITYSLFLFFGILYFMATGCKQKPDRGNLTIRKFPFHITELKTRSDEFSTFRQKVTFTSDTLLNAFLEYWETNSADPIFRSDTSVNTRQHIITLSALKPKTKYCYRIILNDSINYSESEIRHFTTTYIPVWLDNYYQYKEDIVNINGKILIYQRKGPGVLVLLNSEGKIEWSNVFNNFLKTARYSRNNTFLCILSDPGYKTAYGNHIVELNFMGDTLTHLQTKEGTGKKLFHHDLLLDKHSNIVTLTQEEKTFDLSSVGGLKQDIVAGDGIQIISRNGKTVWEWSVFDVVNPLCDPDILKEKKDWLHANSLCYDKDGNFLISFYKSHQIWKINSETGELIWKLGKNGDFKMADEANFSGLHSIHINQNGHLMFFDNGLESKVSRAVSLDVDETTMTANLVINASLPAKYFSPRMGSAYLLDKNRILHCSSNKDKVIATDLKGNVIWHFNTGGLTYRAQYIE